MPEVPHNVATLRVFLILPEPPSCRIRGHSLPEGSGGRPGGRLPRGPLSPPSSPSQGEERRQRHIRALSGGPRRPERFGNGAGLPVRDSLGHYILGRRLTIIFQLREFLSFPPANCCPPGPRACVRLMMLMKRAPGLIQIIPLGKQVRCHLPARLTLIHPDAGSSELKR